MKVEDGEAEEMVAIVSDAVANKCASVRDSIGIGSVAKSSSV